MQTQPPFRFGDNRTMTGSSKRHATAESGIAGGKRAGEQTGEQICNVALLGFGTVGSSVARILCERPNTHLRLTHVLNRNVARKKVDWLPPSVQWTESIDDVLASDAEIVVEVMGGVQPTEDWIRRALAAGKSVVTANKQLIAHCGPELITLARQMKQQIQFGASVAGGVPVISGLHEGLAGDELFKICGILNGTCNYILSQIEATGIPFATALREAQKLGFAEADPTEDIDGLDARAKLAILARVGLHCNVRAESILTRSIAAIDSVDFEYAKQLGCTRRFTAAISSGRGTTSPTASSATFPPGSASTSRIIVDAHEMDAMLDGGASWAMAQGYGVPADLERIEEDGRVPGANPDAVSARAKKRQRDEMGTLGSGNHYLEVQEVTAVHDETAASAFGLRLGELVVSIHCGSRGLGHQIGTEYLREMAIAAPAHNIALPDLELACAPIRSELGQRYLGAMRAAINCALANRQILTHLTRRVFGHFFPGRTLDLLFDVSHNTCKEEWHDVAGRRRRLFVHRKGATRAFGARHPDLPAAYEAVGQPVFIGGSMGTSSAIMVGASTRPERAFASACHGAGRSMSRHQALKRWRGRQVVDDLAERGIIVKSHSSRGVAEEAPGAYKDIDAVVEATHMAGLARKVARLMPIICVKG